MLGFYNEPQILGFVIKQRRKSTFTKTSQTNSAANEFPKKQKPEEFLTPLTSASFVPKPKPLLGFYLERFKNNQLGFFGPPRKRVEKAEIK